MLFPDDIWKIIKTFLLDNDSMHQKKRLSIFLKKIYNGSSMMENQRKILHELGIYTFPSFSHLSYPCFSHNKFFDTSSLVRDEKYATHKSLTI